MKTTVAIVGAGPTGLACGIELRRRNIDCVLFDTAAGLNGMSETVVKACDYVILPQQG